MHPRVDPGTRAARRCPHCAPAVAWGTPRRAGVLEWHRVPHGSWGTRTPRCVPWGDTGHPVGPGAPPRRAVGSWDGTGLPVATIGRAGAAPTPRAVRPRVAWGTLWVPGHPHAGRQVLKLKQAPHGARGAPTSGWAGTRHPAGPVAPQTGLRAPELHRAALCSRGVHPGVPRGCTRTPGCAPWGGSGDPRTRGHPESPGAPRAGTVLSRLAPGVPPPPGVQPAPARPHAYLGAGPEPWGAAWRGRRSGAARCTGAHGRCRGGCSPPSPPPRRREQQPPWGMARVGCGHGWARYGSARGSGGAEPCPAPRLIPGRPRSAPRRWPRRLTLPGPARPAPRGGVHGEHSAGLGGCAADARWGRAAGARGRPAPGDEGLGGGCCERRTRGGDL